MLLLLIFLLMHKLIFHVTRQLEISLDLLSRFVKLCRQVSMKSQLFVKQSF